MSFLENIEASLNFGRELARTEIEDMQNRVTEILGGPKLAYAELKQTKNAGEYLLMVRRASIQSPEN